jgi:hypothetical protein
MQKCVALLSVPLLLTGLNLAERIISLHAFKPAGDPLQVLVRPGGGQIQIPAWPPMTSVETGLLVQGASLVLQARGTVGKFQVAFEAVKSVDLVSLFESIAAIAQPATLPHKAAPPAAPPPKDIIYGQQVSPEFKAKILQIAQDLGVDPDYLMAVMAFESGLNPSAQNRFSCATGLIQFMRSTAKNLGTSIEELRNMTAEEQLDYVQEYFAPYKDKLKTLEDTYMAVLYPAGIGQPNDYVLFEKRPETEKGTKKYKQYEQNAGLDSNHDGQITKAEAAAKVKERLERGEKSRG